MNVLELLKRYAAEHGLTLTEALDRVIRLREGAEEGTIHPEIERIAGLIPADVDARALYHEHMVEKHR